MKNGLPCKSQHSSRKQECAHAPGLIQGFSDTKLHKLDRFIDKSSLRGREGARAARARVDVPCAVSSCWDGLSMTAAPFSRLDENRMLATSVKPTACAGARVMELEKNSSGGIFRRPVTVSGRMQLTQEQERCRFLAHDGPLARAAAAGAQENLVVEEPFFDSKVVVGPEVVVTRQPTALDRAGSQGDKALLTPEERRQINDYKAKAEAARRLSRKARDQKTRLHCILRRCYPMGATGVDSPSNPSTEVYADARRKACKAEAVSCARAAARRQRLDDVQGNPSLRFGYNPWQHHAPDMGKEEDVQSGESRIRGHGGQKGARAMQGVRGKNGGQRFLQAKGGPWRTGDGLGRSASYGLQSLEEGAQQGEKSSIAVPSTQGILALHDTHQRIFEHVEPMGRSDPRFRAQRLWDEGVGRRDYNIVSSVKHFKATEMPERPTGRLAHPSQHSLERGRNLQGSLVPV